MSFIVTEALYVCKNGESITSKAVSVRILSAEVLHVLNKSWLKKAGLAFKILFVGRKKTANSLRCFRRSVESSCLENLML